MSPPSWLSLTISGLTFIVCVFLWWLYREDLTASRLSSSTNASSWVVSLCLVMAWMVICGWLVVFFICTGMDR